MSSSSLEKRVEEMTDSESVRLLRKILDELGDTHVGTPQSQVGSIATDKKDEAVVLDTRSFSIVSVGIEGDEKASYSIDTSRDNSSWETKWDTVDDTKSFKDTYITGSRYVRVRVYDESASAGTATITISASG